MIPAFFGFLIGTILGSLVKALADRSLREETFSGRSYCPKCKKSLVWFDLIPILSYFVLGGKCRYCKSRIGIEYPLVEIGMGILTGLLFFLNPIISPSLIFHVFFITILGIIFLTDLKEMLIPDSIILPSIGISLIYLMIFDNYFLDSLLTGLVIAGFFLILIIITRSKGMGGGDVKLGMFLGLGLGFPNGILALMLSFFSGAIFAVALIILKKKKFGQVIPFGPFLVLASLISLFWGTNILNWYLRFPNF